MNVTARAKSLCLTPVQVVLAGFLVTPCLAQAPSAQYIVTMTEVYAGTTTPVANPNGMIEPGESALFRMTISFAPGVGGTVQTPHGPGTVEGFNGFVARWWSLTAGGAGEWSHLALAPGWGPYSGELFPGMNGSMLHLIGPLQLPSPTIPLNPANPIDDIWQGVWTPHSYVPRTQEWILTPDGGGVGNVFGRLWAQYGTDPVTGDPLLWSVEIPRANVVSPIVPVQIIPAPGSGLALAIAGLAAARRRRR
jgi:hypothetical protein